MRKSEKISSKVLSELIGLKRSTTVPEDIIYNSFFHLLFIKAIYKISSLRSIVKIYDDEWELLSKDTRSKDYFLNHLIPSFSESNDKNIKYYFESAYKDLQYINNDDLLKLYSIVNLIALERMTSKQRYEIIEEVLDGLANILAKGTAYISYRTPKKLRDFITLILDPKANVDRIADLTCGTGSLLLSACAHAYKDFSTIQEQTVHGIDINRGMLNIFTMHSYISGIYHINIEQKDILKEIDPQLNRYNKVYGNSPLGMRIGSENISSHLTIFTRNADVLFLKAIMTSLAHAGHAAVIIPKSILFSTALGHVEIRKELIENMHLEVIISLPVRYEYTALPLVLIVFKNITSDKPILFIELDRGVDVKKDTDIITKRLKLANRLYHNYCNSDYDIDIDSTSDEISDLYWFVEKEKVRNNEYILDLPFYRPEIKQKVIPIKNILISMQEHYSQMIEETKKIQNLIMAIEKIDTNYFKEYKLGDICTMRSGRAFPRESDVEIGELPWVQIRDITKLTGFEITSAEKFISNKFAHDHHLTIVEAGTILISVRGTLGTVALAGRTVCIGPNIVAINIIDTNVDTAFLFGWFLKRKSMFAQNAQGTIPMLTISMLKALSILIPSRQEQSLFVAYSLAMKNLEKLKKLSLDNNIQVDQVADSLFDYYFKS